LVPHTSRNSYGHSGHRAARFSAAAANLCTAKHLGIFGEALAFVGAGHAYFEGEFAALMVKLHVGDHHLQRQITSLGTNL